MLWSVKMTSQAKATVILILGLGILYEPLRTPFPHETANSAVNSASIATIIRIKYLSTLQDTDDLLCTSSLPIAVNDKQF